MSIALPAPDKYDEPEIVSWKKWTRGIRNFLTATGITNDARKKATLLHFAGQKINDIFDTLAEEDDSDSFEVTMQKISDHLEPKKNIAFNRYTFRSIKQQEGETTKSYVIRLKEEAMKCEFDKYSVNEAIVEQVVVNSNSDKLRQKLLEAGAGKDLSLETVLSAASVVEETKKQMSELRRSPSIRDNEEEYSTEDYEEEINLASNYKSRGSFPRQRGQGKSNFSRTKSENKTCPKCGYNAHNDMSRCPAKGKTCSHCQKPNHFWSVCRGRNTNQTSPNDNPRELAYNSNQGVTYSEEYLFRCSDDTDIDKRHAQVNLNIEGVKVSMIADSGSTTNVIDKNTYEKIKSVSKTNIPLHPTSVKIKSYGSTDLAFL